MIPKEYDFPPLPPTEEPRLGFCPITKDRCREDCVCFNPATTPSCTHFGVSGRLYVEVHEPADVTTDPPTPLDDIDAEDEDDGDQMPI